MEMMLGLAFDKHMSNLAEECQLAAELQKMESQSEDKSPALAVSSIGNVTVPDQWPMQYKNGRYRRTNTMTQAFWDSAATICEQLRKDSEVFAHSAGEDNIRYLVTGESARFQLPDYYSSPGKPERRFSLNPW